ncbi:MAG TPA: hypothetical protein VJL83_00925 [Patescibacteria group bacterium]|nr:hypothetical protein [Patescibacteria group bacterium]
MNGKTVQVELPIEIIKQIFLQLPSVEKKKILHSIKPTSKKKPRSLKGIMKGLTISDKEIEDAKKSLVHPIYELSR